MVANPVPTGLLPAPAIQEKLLHGSVTATGPVFLVAPIGHRSGWCSANDRCPTNAVWPPSWSPCWVGWTWQGMVVTLDALHTTKKTARLTSTLHAHHLLALTRMAHYASRRRNSAGIPSDNHTISFPRQKRTPCSEAV